MPDPTADELAAMASAPAETAIDGNTTKARSAADVLALRDAAAAQDAADSNVNPWQMLRPARVILPGGH